MKHTITNRIAALLLLAVGLAGCSKEETLPGTPDATRSPMSITVADSGYASTDKFHTRATDNGYATTFTEGDRIGLYIVNPDGNTYAADNLCLTLTDVGSGTLAWQAPAGKELYYEGATAKNFRYFAYYPYQDNLNGTPVSTATDAPAFFTNVISAWTPATDQSAYTAYTASDLMTGSATLGSKQADGSYPLSFAMTHAMALVVIDIPRTKYVVTDEGGVEIPSFYSSAEFSGFTPHSLAGIYRYLVKPLQSAATAFAGSYTLANGNTGEFTIQHSSTAAAFYACYKVDGGGVVKTHTLQVGDFYMKDGSLVGKDATLSDTQKANCIGVVFKIGRDADDDDNWKDDCDYKFKNTDTPMTIRGYVLALYDARNGNHCTWSPEKGNVGTKTAQNTGFYGYTNTNLIKAYAQTHSKTLSNDFPATYWATEGYEASHPAPTNSSGWFLPSAGQGRYWLDNKEAILAGVRKATGESDYKWKNWYLSSSEEPGYPERDAFGVNVYGNSVGYSYKDNPGYVRGVFAF